MASTCEINYDVIEGTEKLSSLMIVAVSEMYSKSEGKLFQDKIEACRRIIEC